MLRLQQQQRPPSGGSEAELDTMAREDLAVLQRKLRVSEENKKAYSDQAHNVLRKQTSMIQALTREHEELKKNLKLASSNQNELKDMHISIKFKELVEKHVIYSRQISEEQKLIHDIELKTKSIEEAVTKQRKLMGGSQMSQLQHIAVQKQLRVMENRLDKALVRFNTGLSTNARLRTLIDHLRQEKQVFEGLQKKLQKELAVFKREMGEVIDKSTVAYSAREDAQGKLLALKDKADKELAQYQTELKELVRIIDHDQRLRNFMTCKDQERTDAHREMEATRRRKIAEKIEERERTVTSYEEAFQSIQEATSIVDIDHLVSRFIEVEDENFALFNFVNELSGNIELVQEAITGLKEEMAKFQKEGVALEQQRETILQGLEGELKVTQNETKVSESQYEVSSRVLGQLRSSIESVFSKIGCDNTTITELLGGHAGVTESTMLQYLGLIEQRTNELLQLQVFLQVKESDDPEAIAQLLMTKSSLPGLKQPSIVLPSTTSEYSIDSNEDEGLPLTQEELRQRAMKGLTNREARKTATVLPTPPGTAIPQTGKSRSIPSGKKRAVATR
ncbi:PREDICTED: outer dynein arm protein 1-like [Amphimedon queenslandica]|uniref:ODAD1 central coiled coil region domain-containing protein n=1 Tax=Amphimedon queenslandica TaxID=400682 RepID=A0A1X7VUU9_AMPQE|nr:PREDICTED: outer dynein arm protein 1-like [Amphimedon queenslandica]|eukprot:XP_003382690.1 PREDICTED: outer dynein arm protein 1-like [Amphimedon queenslandica]